MNKFRCVGYTDDGCEEYECLACKARWEARHFPAVYCGNCGTKWEGIHRSRPHHVPRWAWDLYPPDGFIPWEVRELMDAPYRRLRNEVWVLESKHENDGKLREAKWEIQRILRGSECAARNAKSLLESWQRMEAEDRDDDDEWEGHDWLIPWGRKLFRVRRLTGDERDKYR